MMSADHPVPAADADDAPAGGLAEAARVLATYVDDSGHRRGCITQRARLVASSCEHVTWARAALDEYGQGPDASSGDIW